MKRYLLSMVILGTMAFGLRELEACPDAISYRRRRSVRQPSCELQWE